MLARLSLGSSNRSGVKSRLRMLQSRERLDLLADQMLPAVVWSETNPGGGGQGLHNHDRNIMS